MHLVIFLFIFIFLTFFIICKFKEYSMIFELSRLPIVKILKMICKNIAKKFNSLFNIKQNKVFVEHIKSDKAMTLLEIIIVIALLASLMGLIALGTLGQADNAKEEQARIAMTQLSQSLQLYRVHNNRYPTTEQGLQALLSNPGSPRWRGPYSEPAKLQDPWGIEFTYELSGNQFKISSFGIDGVQGTEDDLFYPEEQIQTAQ